MALPDGEKLKLPEAASRASSAAASSRDMRRAVDVYKRQEQLSLYVTSTAAEWEAILAQGGSAGRPLLEQKNDIMLSLIHI